MKRHIAGAAGILIVALTVFRLRASAAELVTLIDGDKGIWKTRNVTGGANWRAADRLSIQADKSTTQGASILVSKKSFKDLELYAESGAATPTAASTYAP